jgi:hypothetical protein
MPSQTKESGHHPYGTTDRSSNGHFHGKVGKAVAS